MAVLIQPFKAIWRDAVCVRYGLCCLFGLLWLAAGAWALAGAAPALLLASASSSAEEASSGYPLKAAFLYNFIQYVKWPEAKEANAGQFVLCVLGQNPFGAALEPLKSKTALNAPLVVKELRQAGEAAQCHILFISASEQPHLAKILGETKDAGVLTVGDTEGYAEAGVAINFILRQQKLRFAINPDAAKGSQVRISAHLLRLAEIVQSSGP